MVGLAACQSTSQIAKVDKLKRKIEIQSQSDPSSAMHHLQKQGVLDQTVENLKASIKKNPRNIKSLLNLSQIYLSQVRLNQAENLCRRALKVDLDNQAARKILAQIYFRRQNYDMANIILNSLDKEVAKESDVLNLRAMIHLQEGRSAAALALFKQALKKNSGDVAVRMNLGVLYVQYKQLDQAAVQFERVLKVMPEHPDAKLHLAIIHASRKNYAKAESLYEEVMGIDSQNPVAVYNMAVLDERRGNYDDAIDYLRSYLDSKYAKTKNNKEVFSLLNRIRTEKEASGDAMSDDEIQELATKAKRAPIAETTASLEEEDVTEEEPPKKPAAVKAASKPVESAPKPAAKPKQPTSYDSDEAEIEALERALQ
jgi:tetratricopeptide (TPR) repeat protein